MLQLPFFEELNSANNILLAGAGGGFDIFCGLPLYFGLKAAGKNVHLANLSFSFLPPPTVDHRPRLSPALLTVTADTRLFTDYFPELHLSRWFRDQGSEVPIYCFENDGVKPLLASYQTLVEHLSLDTVILVDGGMDSLMRGDEQGLGTPYEDISSIAAVHQLQVARKMLVCMGFGVDHFHGVCHAHFLEAVSELIRQHGYLGMFSVMQEMPEAQQYKKAAEAVFAAMSAQNTSIVSTSILDALAGHYGNHHSTSRTKYSVLWINPLMPVYWCFRLEAVANRILYLEEMKQAANFSDVVHIVKNFRTSCPSIRPAQSIPV